MRHLMGVVLAIVMVTVLFFAGAWGYLRLTARDRPAVPAAGRRWLPPPGPRHARRARRGRRHRPARCGRDPDRRAADLTDSPPGCPGCCPLGWTAFYVASVRRAVQLIPLKSHPYGAGFEAMLVHGLSGGRRPGR